VAGCHERGGFDCSGHEIVSEEMEMVQGRNAGALRTEMGGGRNV
jgi:hypothetical protein